MNDVHWAMPPLPGRTLSNLNLRDSPGGDVVGQLPKGAAIGVLGTETLEADIDGNEVYLWYIPVVYVLNGVVHTGWVWEDKVDVLP